MLKVHAYSKQEELFEELLDIDQIFQLIEEQDTQEEEEDNFIGFTAPSSQYAIIQFIRQNKIDWIIDIPCYDDSYDYFGSLVTALTHNLIFSIVSAFYYNSYDFQTLVNNRDYIKIKELFNSQWKINFNFTH